MASAPPPWSVGTVTRTMPERQRFPRRRRLTRGAELDAVRREGKRIRTELVEVRVLASLSALPPTRGAQPVGRGQLAMPAMPAADADATPGDVASAVPSGTASSAPEGEGTNSAPGAEGAREGAERQVAMPPAESRAARRAIERPEARIGIIVPRHRHSAVERNRLKRRLRELVRLRLLPVLPTGAIVLRARPEAYGASFEQLARQVDRARRELERILRAAAA